MIVYINESSGDSADVFGSIYAFSRVVRSRSSYFFLNPQGFNSVSAVLGSFFKAGRCSYVHMDFDLCGVNKN